MPDNELYHYGKMGMRWGQHRYHDRYGGMTKNGQIKRKELENEHERLSNIARLTPAGVKRRSEIEKQYEHLTGRPISERTQVPKPKAKSVSEMTNEELTAYNTRKQLETTYQNFQPKPQISKGRQFATAMGKKFILPIAVDVGKAYLTSMAIDKTTGKDMSKAAGKAAEEATKAAGKSAEKAMRSLSKK